MRRQLTTIAAAALLLAPAISADTARFQGDLGYINALGDDHPASRSASAEIFRRQATDLLNDMLPIHLRAQGGESVELTRAHRDQLGQVHLRFQQKIEGLTVYGADMVLHADAETGRVSGLDGDFVPNRSFTTHPSLRPREATDAIRRVDELRRASVISDPELAFLAQKDGAALVYRFLVRYAGPEGEARDWVYVDAHSGEVLMAAATIHRAKSWRTYSANNGSSLPGSLRCDGNQSCGDTAAQAAHDGASSTYDYYSSKYGRDSLNNSGMALVSTVHYSSNYNNAFWNGSQMVYGDGDGSTFIELSRSLDVVAHELTHGVTEYESNLVYQRESGAMNEAMSDIFGAAVEAWVDGGVSTDTWRLGEDIYTPGTSGDALRYMNNPTADGYSADYYPERLYASCGTPTQNNDYCGVHGNSGIANLAFVLLVQGGSHPRGKTSVAVPALGIAKAEQIFYRANSVYLTSSSDFEDLRNATATAADDLYGTTEVNAVHAAWDAVGVPGGSGGGGGGTGTLQNGIPVNGLSGSTGAQDFWTFSVPSGASDLVVELSGGSGDADLYVRYGSAPTTSSYDCRPYKSGNAETCSWTSPSAGTWHVMIRAYSSYSNATVEASWSTTAPNDAPTASFTFSTSDLFASFTDTSSDSDGSIASRSWSFGDGSSSSSTNPSHTYAAGGTYSVTLTVTDDDGASDSITRSVTVTDPPGGGGAPCTGCDHYTGTLSGSGDQDYQPNGTYYYSGSGTHHGWLEGAGTDFDLYLYKWSGGRWRTMASSLSSGSSEEVTYSGSSGYYLWEIRSYSGSGGYDVWLDLP